MGRKTIHKKYKDLMIEEKEEIRNWCDPNDIMDCPIYKNRTAYWSFEYCRSACWRAPEEKEGRRYAK